MAGFFRALFWCYFYLFIIISEATSRGARHKARKTSPRKNRRGGDPDNNQKRELTQACEQLRLTMTMMNLISLVINFIAWLGSRRCLRTGFPSLFFFVFFRVHHSTRITRNEVALERRMEGSLSLQLSHHLGKLGGTEGCIFREGLFMMGSTMLDDLRK